MKVYTFMFLCLYEGTFYATLSCLFEQEIELKSLNPDTCPEIHSAAQI